MENKIFIEIDKIIEKIDCHKIEPIFSNEIKSRNKREISNDFTNNEIIEIIINTKIFDEIFENYNIEKIIKMNPCDLADKYWDKIKGIRQQAKLFHIITLARKLKKIGPFNKILNELEIPKKIKSEKDIDQFWIGFKKFRTIMENNKIPFFRSTTSLLHFLLEIGYDCVKPDLVVMKVSKKLGIVQKETGEKNLIQTVKIIQEYSIERKIRPSIIDFYFLIDEGQLEAKKYVKSKFYY
jgi:hypothetical protein